MWEPMRSALESRLQRLPNVGRHDKAGRSARRLRSARLAGDEAVESQPGRLEQATLSANRGPQAARQRNLAGEDGPRRTGRSRRLDASAVAIARSAAGSSIRRPPATFT